MLILWLLWQVLSFILIIFAALLALPVIGFLIQGILILFCGFVLLGVVMLATKAGRNEFMRQWKAESK